MITVLAFLLAICVLVAVHEYGHFLAARACGVQVLRFAVGMGPVLARWKSHRSGTEYVLGSLPIGGYVKMLGDDGVGAQGGSAIKGAFHAQSWNVKAMIALAGPLANLVLAVLLIAVLGWHGVEQASPVLSVPRAGSLLANAGMQGGEKILRMGIREQSPEPVRSFDDLRWKFAKYASQGETVHIEYVGRNQSESRQTVVDLQPLVFALEGDGTRLYQEIGLLAPLSPAVLGALEADGAAKSAGLLSGDRILRVNQTDIVDAGQLRDSIRKSASSGQVQPQQWRLVRGTTEMVFWVTPKTVDEAGQQIGRVGAVIGQRPQMTTIELGWSEGLQYGIERVWDLGVLTLRTIGRMVIGQASLQQLSGPLTMADYAGKSALLGWEAFVHLLAVLSVSLGVLNLLPIPVLDGGHLLYYLWEYLSGRPVPAMWAERLQMVGLVLLGMMMSVAIFNDLARLLR